MMLEGYGPRKGHEPPVRRVQEALPDEGVVLDFLEFIEGQLARLVQDRIGNPDLADVVHGRCGLQKDDVLRGKAVLPAEQRGIRGHPAHMVGRVLRAGLDDLAQNGQEFHLGVDHLLVQGHDFHVSAMDLPLLEHVHDQEDDDHAQDADDHQG